MKNSIQCKASTSLRTAEIWQQDQPISFVYAPAGTHEINASWNGKPTKITVCVDERTADALNDSFVMTAATEPLGVWADEEHMCGKATLRFPAGRTRFYFGELRGERGVICDGAEPTSYGAELVNGRTYRSWSPEFSTDAQYELLRTRDDGQLVFPQGTRGSESNPARITGLGSDCGALTNQPAFRLMPPVKCSRVWTPADFGLQWLFDRREESQKFLQMLADREGRRKMVDFLESVKTKQQ